MEQIHFMVENDRDSNKCRFYETCCKQMEKSEFKITLKMTEQNGNEMHHLRQDENARNMECRNTSQPVVDTSWMSVPGKQLKMDNELRDEIEVNHNTEDVMIEMIFHAGSDISMKNNQIRGCWKLVNFDNEIIKSR